MEVQYFKDYSPALERDMECKVYGHAGRRSFLFHVRTAGSLTLKTTI